MERLIDLLDAAVVAQDGRGVLVMDREVRGLVDGPRVLRLGAGRSGGEEAGEDEESGGAQVVNDLPQEQVETACGFFTTNPDCISDSS